MVCCREVPWESTTCRRHAGVMYVIPIAPLLPCVICVVGVIKVRTDAHWVQDHGHRGRRPCMVGTMWVGGQARGSGASWGNSHVDGMVLGELPSMGAVGSPSWWSHSPCLGAGEDMPRGNFTLDLTGHDSGIHGHCPLLGVVAASSYPNTCSE
jgi:hypothetical protein